MKNDEIVKEFGDVYSIFTVNTHLVVPSAEVEDFYITRADVRFPAVKVGSAGWGRWLDYVPVPDARHTADGEEYIPLERVRIGLTKNGNIRFYNIFDSSLPSKDSVVLVIKAWGGYHGSITYRVEDPSGDVTTIDDLPILAHGWKGEGFDGQFGRHEQYILILPRGVRLHLLYAGNTYGRPDHYIVWFNNGEVFMMPPD